MIYKHFDGGTRVNGRKRPIVGDTLGLLLTVDELGRARPGGMGHMPYAAGLEA